MQLTIKKGLYLSLLFIFIGLFRQLSWHNNCFNVDELGWIYLLERIKYNALPFEGFTAHTSGPLSIYFLSIINLFVENPTLKSLRIFQFVVCIIPSMLILHNSISKNGKWLGVFILFLFFITCDFPVSNDLLAYNTEYQILLFTAIIYYLQKDQDPHFIKILITSFLTISIFLVKSQAIIFAAYFNLIYFIQLFLVNKRKSYLLILSTLLTLVFYYLLFDLLGVLDGFYHEYLFKNLLYSKLEEINYITQILAFIKFITTNLLFFWLLFFIILAITLWYYLKGKLINPISKNFIRSLLFFLISLLTIYISTNNFVHYKILLFIPMSLLIGELAYLIDIKSIQLKVAFVSILTILFVLLNSPIFLEIGRKLKKNKLAEFQLSIGEHYLYFPSCYYFDKPQLVINKSERQEVMAFMTNELKKTNKDQNKIFIMGWFVAQGFYYELLKYCVPISKSAQNQYLMDFYNYSEWAKYKVEEEKILHELKSDKPKWIIDSEEILIHLQKFPIRKYITENYQLALQTKSITVYQLKGAVK